jgi:integrase
VNLDHTSTCRPPRESLCCLLTQCPYDVLPFDVLKLGSRIAARTLLDFHTYLLNEIEHDRISRYYARDNMASLKQFVKWCWELELCDLPRNFSSKDLGFTLTAMKIERFEKEEIDEMFKRASERTRLYVLLTLNCGMQQQDIANLQHSEVDWNQGRITRKRGKTKRFENVPTVCYLLWSETFELLKSHRSDDADFVLLNENGRPLRAEAVDNGAYSKIDNIRSAFSRLTKKLKIKKPFKLLRKTSATVLSEHKHYKAYVQHFLGQAPSTVAERHYATPSQDLFDEAIVWLGGQYGLGQV